MPSLTQRRTLALFLAFLAISGPIVHTAPAQTSTSAGTPAPNTPPQPVLVGEPIKAPTPPCTIRVTDKSPANAKTLSPYRPGSVYLVISPKLLWERYQLVNGIGKEVWKTNGAVFIGNPDSSEVIPFTSTWQPTLTTQSEFDWVRKELYRGTVSLNGESLLIFSEDDPDELAQQQQREALAQMAATMAQNAAQGAQSPPASGPGGKSKAGAPAKGSNSPGGKASALPALPPPIVYPPGPLGGLPMKPGVRVAAIEEKSRLPKYIQNGAELRLYEYGVPTPDDLTLPPKVAKMLVRPKAP